MKNTKRIRVGIIGAGANTRARHIPGLMKIPGVEIAAVANRSLESARRVCSEFAIPQAMAKPEAVLRHPEIDAIVIGTWPYRHAAYACAALRAGKHVLTEARMAMDAAEAARMLAESRRRPRQVAMVVPSPFTLACDHVIQDFVRSRLGKIVSVELSVHTGQFPGAGLPLSWRHQRRYSGNNIMTVGIYAEALFRWLGPARTVSASMKTMVPYREDKSSGKRVKVDVPDLVNMQGQFKKDGALYRMNFSDACGFAKTNECLIHGTEASLRIPFDGNLFLKTRGQSEAQAVAYEPRAAWRVEEEFIGAIRGTEKVAHTTFAAGLDYMRFTDAVHESARRGKTVEI